MDGDASLVEINPLVLTTDGRVHALDAKVSVDDNALFRHDDYKEYRDILTTDPQEKIAKEKGIAYIKLDGEVGVMGNGAGLVMSTLDLVQLAGGGAANFLDVGGGASGEQIAAGLEIVLSDPKVRSVLVNIFGGIVRCDLVAEGILDALTRVDLKVPMVVRLDGTNAEAGRKILEEANVDGVEVGTHDVGSRTSCRRSGAWLIRRTARRSNRRSDARSTRSNLSSKSSSINEWDEVVVFIETSATKSGRTHAEVIADLLEQDGAQAFATDEDQARIDPLDRQAVARAREPVGPIQGPGAAAAAAHRPEGRKTSKSGRRSNPTRTSGSVTLATHGDPSN